MLLDKFTRVHHLVPVVIFLPAIAILFAYGDRTASASCRRSATPSAATSLWTLAEYWIHRVIFHFEPEDGIRRAPALDGPRRPPRPPERPAAARDAARPPRCRWRWSSTRLFWLVLGADRAFAFGAGFLAGYLAYDMIHYAPAPPHAAHAGRAVAAGAAHAPPLPGRRARLRDQRAVLGSRVRHHARPPGTVGSVLRGADEAEEIQDGEVVDGLPVVTEAGVLEERADRRRPGRPGAALAATGFVAGAATVAVVSRHRTKKALKKSKQLGPDRRDRSSSSFLVDVHLLRRD